MSQPKLLHITDKGDMETEPCEFVTVSRAWLEQLEAREKELPRQLDEERRVTQQLGQRVKPQGGD